MSKLKTVCSIVMVVILSVALLFAVGWLGLGLYKTFATRWESARTDVYRENKSYVEGTIRDLRDLKREYLTAEDQHKDAVRSLILHRAGELDWDRLPSDLRSFLKDLEGIR